MLVGYLFEVILRFWLEAIVDTMNAFLNVGY